MKSKMPYSQALAIAQRIVEALRPYCERIEIAGSLRRKADYVGDIEIVCISKTERPKDMFGLDLTAAPTLTNDLAGKLGRLIKGGDKYKQIDLGEIMLDLFITTPECWGVIFAIRTGPADFSHWLVTPRKYGGPLPSYMHVADGRVWANSQALYTPEEANFFRLLDLPVIPPHERDEYYALLTKTNAR